MSKIWQSVLGFLFILGGWIIIDVWAFPQLSVTMWQWWVLLLGIAVIIIGAQITNDAGD